jgi:hypothetical protein
MPHHNQIQNNLISRSPKSIPGTTRPVKVSVICSCVLASVSHCTETDQIQTRSYFKEHSMMDQIQTRSYFKEHPVTASQSPAHSITSECSQVPGRKVAIKALYPVRQTIQSRIAIPKARKVRTSAKKSRSGCQTCRSVPIFQR